VSSSNNSVNGNTIARNCDFGINVRGSSDNNTISGNNIASTYQAAILIYSSSNNKVGGNNITNNTEGGIGLSYSSNNDVSGTMYLVLQDDVCFNRPTGAQVNGECYELYLNHGLNWNHTSDSGSELNQASRLRDTRSRLGT